MNIQTILDDIQSQIPALFGKGSLPTYIPELTKVNPKQFGMAVWDVKTHSLYQVGQAQVPFSIQSISKVLALSLALDRLDESLWSRVGKEPSGHAFNSIVQLEYDKGIPRNPFMNAGALVMVDALLSMYPNYLDQFLETSRSLSGNPDITIDETTAISEERVGFRNKALANFIKSYGNIHHDVDTVLETYFSQCALKMSCCDLVKAFSFLANQGVSTMTNQRVLSVNHCKRVNSVMLTCGMYDTVGEFAYRVGLPAKSGVGGGILAILPGNMVVCVWSPELDPHGNSLIGFYALSQFVSKSGMSVF